MRLALLVLLTLGLLSSSATAMEPVTRVQGEQMAKTVVLPNQVLITPTEIFIYAPSGDELFTAESIAVENGQIWATFSSEPQTVNARASCSHPKCAGCGFNACLERTCRYCCPWLGNHDVH
jgi:hypothetical protein